MYICMYVCMYIMHVCLTVLMKIPIMIGPVDWGCRIHDCISAEG